MAGLVQLLDPLFQVSPMQEAFARDLHRVQRACQDENRVWLDPRASEVHRWRALTDGGGFEECCLPAETFNCLHVFYVDEERRTYPPVLLPTGNTLPASLYLQWLNTTPRFVEGCEIVWMLAPTITHGTMTYAATAIRLTPGPCMTVEQGRLIWPSRVPSLPPVSPEAEATPGKAPGLPDGPGQAAHVWLEWPAPFDVLFHGTGGGMDMFFQHHEAMRGCIEALHTGERPYRDIVKKAETWVARLTAEVDVPMVPAWFLPKVMANPTGALWEIQGRYGGDYDLQADTVEELYASAGFRAVQQEQVRVKRALGWLGYFWWEFFQDLVAHIPVGICKACGHMVRGGRKDRQYCTQRENPACWRQRTNARQRKSRTGKS